MTRFFELLGAPLRNSHWSWGAVRIRDNAIFLRQWESDVTTGEDGREYVKIAADNQPAIGSKMNGWRERQRHIANIRAGAECYVVIVVAEDLAVEPRRIKQFNVSYIVKGDGLKIVKGATYLRAGSRIPVSSLIRT